MNAIEIARVANSAQASCDCGWLGPRNSLATLDGWCMARDDAKSHAPIHEDSHIFH